MARELMKVFTNKELKAICENADLAAARNSTLAHYRESFTDKLIGKELHCKFDDGINLVYRFMDIHTLEWSENGSDFTQEYYEGLESSVENVFTVHHFRHNVLPFDGEMLILDMDTGLVTWFALYIGSPDNDKDVTPAAHFGEIAGIGSHEGHHHFSTEFVGTVIDWKYSDNFIIRHSYVTPNLTISAAPPGTPEESFIIRRFLPSINIKIRDGLYVVSFVESGGCAAVLLIDMNIVHDVGCFYGINHEGMLSSVTLAAHGGIGGAGLSGEYAIK